MAPASMATAHEALNRSAAASSHLHFAKVMKSPECFSDRLLTTARRTPFALTALMIVTLAAPMARAQDAPRRLIPQPAAPTTAKPEAAEIEATELQAPGYAALSVTAPVCDQPWHGLEPGEIEHALRSMPDRSDDPLVRELAALVAAAGIDATGNQQSLVTRRLEILLGHAQLDQFDDLLDLLPPDGIDDHVTGLTIARTTIGGGDPSVQCGALAGSGSGSVYWRMACSASQRDLQGLGLQLALAGDRGIPIDPALERIAQAIVAEQNVELETVRSVTGWPAAVMLQSAQIASSGLDANAIPPFAALFLSENESLNESQRSDLAERAARYGLGIGDSQLLSAAGSSSDDPFAEIRNETIQAARVQMLRGLWYRTPLEQHPSLGRQLAPFVEDIRVDQAFVWGADALIPILLSAGDRDRALSWFKLVERDGASTGLDDQTRQRLAIYLALAVSSVTAPPATDNPFLLASLTALGYRIPIEAIGRTANPAPSISAWLGLERSLASNACNATLSHMLTLLGAERASLSPLAAYAAIQALVSIGLEKEARQLAVNIALSSPTAP